MRFLRHIIAQYTALVWALLKPLGSWGAFGIAAIDAAFIGLPLDPVVAGYIYVDRPRFLLYALMASAGSALGSILLYLIGRKGGELLLLRRISEQRFEKVRSSFERHEFLALMLPSMLPPPAPFKLFVLSAGVFQMHFAHFLLAIFSGRMVRFLILSLLTLKFGPQIVPLAAVLFREHLAVAVGTIIAVVIIGFAIYRLWREPVIELEHELEK